MCLLDKINKGMTPKEAEEGMAKAKEVGIDVLVSIIFGIGGKERSKEHIAATTRLLNITKPEILAPMALTIQPGTVLAKQVESGGFIRPTPLQILEEEKYLLENLDDFSMYYLGDHGNNIVSMKGEMPKQREQFIQEVDEAIASHPIAKQDVLLSSPW